VGILILINIFRFFTARLGPNKYVEDNLEFFVYEVDLSIFDRGKKKTGHLLKDWRQSLLPLKLKKRNHV
jgi:hypothetical protein